MFRFRKASAVVLALAMLLSMIPGTVLANEAVSDDVAVINGEGYATLEQALAAAQEGQTVVLQADAEISATTNINKSITINGAGHKITQAEGFVTNGANVVFDIFGNATVTFEKVTFDGIKTVGVMRTVDANIVMDNCVVQNCEQTVAQGLLRLACGNATITNSKFLNNSCTMVLSFGYDAAYDTDVLVIDGCTFEGNTCSETAVVYFAGGDYGKVMNSQFLDNAVSSVGNAATLYMGWGAGFSVTGCLFDGNEVTTSHATTKRFASAIFADGCAVTGNVFGENTAIRNGETITTTVAIAAYYGAADVSANYWGGKAPVLGVDYTVEYSRNEVAFESYYTTYENGELGGLTGTAAYVAYIGTQSYATLKEAVAAAVEGDTIVLMAGTIEEGTIKLPATLKNVTFKGETGATLKDMTIMASDGNSFSYIGLTFDGITFENSRLSFTGWRNGDEIIENLTITNCIFKNLHDDTNSAPVHINKDAPEAVKDFTFTNNVIDGATGGSKSGIYAQVTGKVTVTGNIINNVSFRPYVIQLTTDDGIADEFTVTGNTFSGSAAGRVQGLGSNAKGTDTVKLVVSNNIFKDITNSQQICYWNFNPETTTADLSKNYYDINVAENPGKIYFNVSAADVEDLVEMGVYPYYTELNADGTIKAESLIEAPETKEYVAQVGEQKFESLQEAIDAANGGEIKILCDIFESFAGIENVTFTTDVAGGVTITNTFAEDEWIAFNNVTLGSGVTLVMPNVLINGAKDGGSQNVIEGTLITGVEGVAGTSFYQYNDAKTTVQNGGKIVVYGDTVLRYNYNTDSGIFIYGDGDNTTVEYAATGYIGAYSGAFYAKDAVVNTGDLRLDYHDIKNGVVKGEEPDKYAPINAEFVNSTVSVSGQLRLYKDAHLTLTGSNVTAGLVQSRAEAKPVTNIDSASSLKANAVEVVTGALVDAIRDAQGNVTFAPMVVKIGNKTYSSLQAAVDAANGETVALLTDIVLDAPIVVNGTVVLDLNGCNITYTSDVMGEAMITNKGNLTINGDGEIYYNYVGANDASYGKGNYTICNAGTLTVNGGKIYIANLSRHAKYPIDNNSTTGDAILVINGGHLYNYNTSAIRQFCNSTVYKNSVTINGGLIEGYCAVWVQNPGNNTVNGQLTITGGEIRTTAKAWVEGTAELKNVGSAIYFTVSGANGAWSEDSFVTITGGTFNENVYLAEQAPAVITIGEEVTFNGYLELPVHEHEYAIDGDYIKCVSCGEPLRKQVITLSDGYTYKTNYSGMILKNHICYIDGERYEFNDKGQRVEEEEEEVIPDGIVTIEGVDYIYMNGAPVRKQVITLSDGHTYKTNYDGKVLKNHICYIDGERYEFNDKGQRVEEEEVIPDGIVTIEGVDYIYMNGAPVRKQVITLSDGYTYKTNYDGKVLKNHICYIDGERYEFNDKGQRVNYYDGIVEINGEEYIYKNNSLVRKQVITLSDGHTYKTNYDGKILKNHICYIDGVRYEFNEYGHRVNF